jgi:hypothetical protein
MAPPVDSAGRPMIDVRRHASPALTAPHPCYFKPAPQPAQTPQDARPKAADRGRLFTSAIVLEWAAFARVVARPCPLMRALSAEAMMPGAGAAHRAATGAPPGASDAPDKGALGPAREAEAVNPAQPPAASANNLIVGKILL